MPRRDLEDRLRKTEPCSAAVMLVGITALAWGIGGCTRKGPPPAPPPPAVTVARPVLHEVIEWDEYPGRLDAVDSADVRARVSGLIVKTLFQEGAVVRQGDVLVELDVRPFQADLDSKLAAEQQAAAQVDLATITYNHTKEMWSGNSATIIEYQTAEANLRAAQAALAGAEANVETARLNVEWCRVAAPIAGRISRKYVTEGNLVTGGNGTGTLLTTITSIDPIYCYLDVNERSMLKYQRLAQENKRPDVREAHVPCKLQLADEHDFPHPGTIDFVDNRVTPDTGTIWLRGVFPDPDGWLVPGMFGRVRIPGSAKYQALLVPDLAVATDQNEKILFVLGPGDIVQVRAVKLGALFGGLRAIQSGISSDDRVIINGLMQARAGSKVSPQESEIPVTMLRPEMLGLTGSQELAATPKHAGKSPQAEDPTTENRPRTPSTAPSAEPATTWDQRSELP
jgi:RND family efflux transporter MFP subunit